MKLLGLLTFALSVNVLAANILVVGDSHTAGPFGQSLKKEIQKNHNVTVFGHSSSAAYHWIDSKNFYLSGGVYHGGHINGTNLVNPNPTHWRTKVKVPKYKDFVTNLSYHSSWSKKTGVVKPDVAVIALGANDLRIIAKSDGTKNPTSYKKRQDAILGMLKLIKDNRMQCIWIAPPDSVKKPVAQQDTLYEYLREVVLDQCDFFSSRHHVAKYCDGIHFNCSKQYSKEDRAKYGWDNAIEQAAAWAKEVAEFIDSKVD